VLCSLASSADAQNTAEDRLRAQLRAATVQLRTLQDQNATLQAGQAQAERQRMELADQLAAAEKEIASLKGQVGASQSATAMADARAKRSKKII